MAGRQAIYFRCFFDVGTVGNSVITNADAEHYANAYGDPDHLRSAFEVYRALAADITLSTMNTATVDVPLLPSAASTYPARSCRLWPRTFEPTTAGPTCRSRLSKNAGITCLRKDPPRSPNSSSATP